MAYQGLLNNMIGDDIMCSVFTFRELENYEKRQPLVKYGGCVSHSRLCFPTNNESPAAELRIFYASWGRLHRNARAPKSTIYGSQVLLTIGKSINEVKTYANGNLI